jgi:hypothetical protein
VLVSLAIPNGGVTSISILSVAGPVVDKVSLFAGGCEEEDDDSERECWVEDNIDIG